MYPTAQEPRFGCFVKEQAEDLEAIGLEIEVLDFDGRRERSNYVRAAGQLRRLIDRRDFDLIHAHFGLTGAVAMTQRRLPVITTFHGTDTGYVRWMGYVSWLV